MSETEKIKEIYDKNVFLPSQNNICGIVTKDDTAYKCPSNKFCNYGGLAGICENTDCIPDAFVNKPINMDYRKFDGSDVSRIVDVSGNIKSFNCDRKISTDGKCGLDNNSTKCPDGQCCSIKGNCGNDKESCLYIGPRYSNNKPFAQFISPYYNDFSNNLVATLNREFYSKYRDVDKYEEQLIEQIGKKYVGNNNFEMYTNGECGLDLEKEKIVKCPDIQYCGRNSKCSTDYGNYNTTNDNIYLNFPDLNLNLMHGNKFNEEYNKWYDNRKEKLDSIHNKYINNNFEISTNGSCGIDLENEKIFKCSGNQYCNDNIKKCSTDYDKVINTFTFNDYSLTDLSSNAVYLKKKDSHLRDETRLKDLSSNLMNGETFNEELDKWLDDKIKNNQFVKASNMCGKLPSHGVVYKCANNNDCCINNECKSGEICKNADPNSKLHGDTFLVNNKAPSYGNPNKVNTTFISQNTDTLFVSQNMAPSVNLDCNDSQLLDSLEKSYYEYNKKHNIEIKRFNIIKSNKVDNNTCDIKYIFENKIPGQSGQTGQVSRRITFQYNPDIRDWKILKIGEEGSGLTTEPDQIVFPSSAIVYIVITGIIVLVLIMYKLFIISRG